MPSPRNKELRLAVLVAALVAAGGLVPLAYHYGQTHKPGGRDTTVAAAPGSAPAPAAPAVPAAAPGADNEAVPAAPPGAEQVPPEESETDHGPASASPAGPTMSFGRAAGLHLQPDPLHLSSSAAIVLDESTGQMLAHKNENTVLPIASLTKLMTTMLVLEAKQPMDEVLTITDEDVDTERHSRSRLRPGTKLTREEALHLALMSSENRAAHALGRNYPGGLPKLVEAMNVKAHALGMSNTTYVDPTGLSNRNQSTAHDLALLVAQAAKNPVMRDFSTTPTHVADLNGRALQYLNSNRLVRNHNSGWDIELQKTGYIVEAGRCMTVVTKVAGHDLILVLLDSDSNGTRIADAQRLRKWVVAQNGWQDAPVLAKAPADKPEHVAAADDKPAKAEKHARAEKHAKAKTKTAKADKAETVAAAKAHKEHASAHKDGKAHHEVASATKTGEKKDTRVTKTFTVAHAEHKD